MTEQTISIEIYNELCEELAVEKRIAEECRRERDKAWAKLNMVKDPDFWDIKAEILDNCKRIKSHIHCVQRRIGYIEQLMTELDND